MFPDLLLIYQEELKKKQYAAILDEYPVTPDAIRNTGPSVYKNGLYQLNQLIDKSILDSGLLETCRLLAATDPAFSYVKHIPRGAFLAAYRSQSLEESLYGRATDAVAQLAILLSAFTNLLDGIIDETPLIISPQQLDALQQVLADPDWEARRYARSLHFPDAHPMVRLLLDITCHIIDTLIESPHWQQLPFLQREFKQASEAAVKSEIHSARYQNLFVVPSDLVAAQNHLAAKSYQWARVMAWTPVCMNGWPEGFSAADFLEFAFKLGKFGGWLDDLSDLAEDFYSGRWSNVLLEVYQQARDILGTSNDFPLRLGVLLADPAIQRKIVHSGLLQYRQVNAALSRLPLVNDKVRESIIYIIHVFLGDVETELFIHSSPYEVSNA